MNKIIFGGAIRGHNMRIEAQQVKECEQRFNFFTRRISEPWNALSQLGLIRQLSTSSKTESTSFTAITSVFKIIEPLPHFL